MLLFSWLIYVILACAYEIRMDIRPEKYVSIWSDSQGDLEALEAAKITSLLVQQCQKAFNDILIKHSVDCFWSLAILGYVEMKLPTSSQEMELSASLLDMNRPWGSLGRI